MVFHEGGPPVDSLYYKFDWDAIVCFDMRYVEFISKYFPRDIIHIIPYPCHPLRIGNKKEARRKLDLPLDKKIVFSYGFRLKNMLVVLPVLEKLSKRLPIIYLIVANLGGILRT